MSLCGLKIQLKPPIVSGLFHLLFAGYFATLLYRRFFVPNFTHPPAASLDVPTIAYYAYGNPTDRYAPLPLRGLAGIIRWPALLRSTAPRSVLQQRDRHAISSIFT